MFGLVQSHSSLDNSLSLNTVRKIGEKYVLSKHGVTANKSCVQIVKRFKTIEVPFPRPLC